MFNWPYKEISARNPVVSTYCIIIKNVYLHVNNYFWREFPESIKNFYINIQLLHTLWLGKTYPKDIPCRTMKMCTPHISTSRMFSRCQNKCRYTNNVINKHPYSFKYVKPTNVQYSTTKKQIKWIQCIL